MILEDELPAQLQLKRLIEKYYPSFEISAMIGSLEEAAIWLSNNSVDIIFMDVELSDGVCFELYNMVEIESNVIITTAYENYALKAFRINSIDYLLKPIDSEPFVKAVEKCKGSLSNINLEKSLVNQLLSNSKVYKQRLTVKLGNNIIILNVVDIAYFYSEEKYTFIVTKDNKEYLSDYTLESLEEQLNPSLFFKLNRSCMASIHSITSVSKHFNSRLKVKLSPNFKGEILVSRVRVPLFMQWLEGGSI
jgi:DNA-binding LytR/AlgR family response regulator